MKTNKLRAAFAIVSAIILGGCVGNELTPSGKNATILQNQSFGKMSPAARLGSLAIPFSTTSNFAVLAATTVTNDGASFITGDLGVSPGTAITGFQPVPINSISGPGTVTAGLGVVTGTIYAGGPIADEAHNSAVNTYNYLVAQVADTTYSGVTQLNGHTFTPGVYKFAPSANLQVNGTVYLDFQGNSDAVFIFQLGTTLVTMTGSKVIALNNGSQTCFGANVYWTVGSSATIDGSQFIGSVIANTTITMTSGVNVSGRIWALNGAVTMIADTVSVCSATGVPVPPKVCKDFVTGGGWINNKATFGVSGGIKNDKFWGQLSFNDHNGVKVKSTSITGYFVVDAATRQIEGKASVNGQGSYSYKVVVADKGEPGRNDSFSLELSNGYHVSGTLKGGNIQLHKKCGNSHDENNEDDQDEKNGNHDSDANDNHKESKHNQK